MINKQKLEILLSIRDASLTPIEVNGLADILFDDIINARYDFSKYQRHIYTKQGKKRVVYSYQKLSCEDILCQYLKQQLDSIFNVKYASRNKIINLLFNIFPVVKDMNDFVIIRVDFKSFFDSVLVKHIYDNYIRDSMLKRQDKELLELYSNQFKYCYAGLCLSNGMTEIVCRDFDEHMKAKMSSYGVFFYERFVDDILLIVNKYISKDTFIELANATIKKVFGNCPVKLSMSPGKFSYISKRNLQANQAETISFLGYVFELKEVGSGGKAALKFWYGITEKKRRKYKGIIERAIIQYIKDNNLELLRQRIKIYSSRVVIGGNKNERKYYWLTKGVVANYNELRHHMDYLTKDTKKFLKDLYFELFNKYNVPFPYFINQSIKEDSIYNISSNMRRNRSIIFQDCIGVSRATLIKWIQKIDSSYSAGDKDYYHIVADYLDMIKIK